MGKSTISVAIFNSFLYVYQKVSRTLPRPGNQCWRTHAAAAPLVGVVSAAAQDQTAR